MIKFIKYTITFLLGTFIILGLIIIITNHSISNNHSNFEIDKKITTLILGHSHPEGAFNDSLVENTKNLGQSGELHFYTYLKLRKILEDNKNIKTVFLEFTNNEITEDMDKWTRSEEQILYRLPKYAPVMKIDDYRYISSNNPIAFVKGLLMVIKNNLNFVLYRKNNFLVKQDWGRYYYNKRNHVDSLLIDQKKKKQNPIKKFSNVNLEFIKKSINICENNKVNVYLIRSPFHKKYLGIQNELKFQEVLKTNFSDVPFLDFKDFPLQNEDYGDLDHLNYKGARKFSIFFNDLLQNKVLQNKNGQTVINNQMNLLKQ